MNDLIKTIYCYFEEPKHLLNGPIQLPCNQLACEKCILKAREINKNQFKCEYCKQIHKLDDKLLKNKDIKIEKTIKENLNELYEYSLIRLENELNHVENRFKDREKLIENRKFHFESELLIKIESLKDYLFQLEQEIRESLNKSALNLNSKMITYENTIKSEIEEIKHFINVTKKTTKKFNEEILINQSEVLHINLEKFNKKITSYLNELNFEVNNNLPSESIIGYVNKIESGDKQNVEINLEKVKSFQTVTNFYANCPPISPRFITVNEDFVYVTDSNSKSIIKLNANNSQFEKSLLQNIFKSPEGICFNSKGFLFVTDSDLNLVFKFDSKYNLIKKFGSKMLKIPRGIACDDSDVHSMIYVCDYWNQRCCIFNEHGQFYEEFRPVLENSIDSIDIKNENFYPWNVALNKISIFVCDDWTGGNCVRIFSKENKNLIRNISNLDLYNPYGLLIDNLNNYLYTLGHQYYENGSLHLFCFDLNTDETTLVRKIDFNNNSNIFDFAIDRINDKLYCTGEKELLIYNF